MNKGHSVGCPALRNGVPCTCWVPARTQRDSLGDVTHLLGRPLRHWIDIDQQLKRRGYDRFLDGYYEEQAKLHLRIRKLEGQVRELEIEWRGLQAMADDQRKGLEELWEQIAATGEATPWD